MHPSIIPTPLVCRAVRAATSHSRLLLPRISTSTTTTTWHGLGRHYVTRKEPAEPVGGGKTPEPMLDDSERSNSSFYFEAGYALHAKRAPRPFPPPFLSMPSTSFSDPLSTHDRSRDKRQFYNGDVIRGVTNGDDAVLVSDNLIAANDGVGAWATRERGHAG